MTKTKVQTSVGSKDRVETDRQTDIQSDVTDCFTFPANSVSKICSVVMDYHFITPQ